jgi:cell division protein FtsB
LGDVSLRVVFLHRYDQAGMGVFTVVWPELGHRAMVMPVKSLDIFAQRVLPLFVVAGAAVAVPLMMFSPSGLSRLDALRQERARAEEEVARLSREIERLRAEVARVKDDPAYVERAARDELGLLRQTEVVFQFRR